MSLFTAGDQMDEYERRDTHPPQPDAPCWRDIATAPRDGSLVLCFYPDRHGHDRYSLRYWAMGDWGVRSEGWSDQYRQLRKTEPTHWQPLLPSADAKQADALPGDLRERVAAIIDANKYEAWTVDRANQMADAILSLIQSERGEA